MVPASNTTLAEILQENGYATVAAVAGVPLSAKFGFDQGFDAYEAPLGKGGLVSEAGLRLLDEHTDEPVFLFVHYWDAHWPYKPPAPYSTMYRDDNLPLTGTFKEIVELRKALWAKEADAMARSNATKNLYAGGVTYTDTLLGSLFDGLRERGILDEALLVVTADHGESTDMHWDYWTHGPSVYEETVRVPLLIRLPGGDRAGTVVDQAASLVDLFPTILDMAEVSVPAGVEPQGRSLAPALRGEDLGTAPLVFMESTAPKTKVIVDPSLWVNRLNCAAVVEGNLKFHQCTRLKRSELYDLAIDPDEQVDISISQPEDRDRLEAALNSWRAELAVRPVELEGSDETKAQLEALGYIE